MTLLFTATSPVGIALGSDCIVTHMNSDNLSNAGDASIVKWRRSLIGKVVVFKERCVFAFSGSQERITQLLEEIDEKWSYFSSEEYPGESIRQFAEDFDFGRVHGDRLEYIMVEPKFNKPTDRSVDIFTSNRPGNSRNGNVKPVSDRRLGIQYAVGSGKFRFEEIVRKLEPKMLPPQIPYPRQNIAVLFGSLNTLALFNQHKLAASWGGYFQWLEANLKRQTFVFSPDWVYIRYFPKRSNGKIHFQSDCQFLAYKGMGVAGCVMRCPQDGPREYWPIASFAHGFPPAADLHLDKLSPEYCTVSFEFPTSTGRQRIVSHTIRSECMPEGWLDYSTEQASIKLDSSFLSTLIDRTPSSSLTDLE